MSQVNRSVSARLLLAAGSLVAVASGTVVPAAAQAQAPAPTERARFGDHLTVTVRGTGAGDGTHELTCHPAGGDHPDAAGACAALDGGTRWGRDLFAPEAPGGLCTMQYGGPATAHVTGTWAGRPVDARFDRGDGCAIARWNRFVPLLPDVRAQGLGT
ncbi:SSI family serine proteinase inhibitor [Streptomyces sp. NPDC046859]|uniref:SSI family serine proteinase inhibitor n=1 Tax=Streptomyces sp. NPDC046859 TaxID=3155734 RepID=UPI0033E60866